jgi:hypothetical protein
MRTDGRTDRQASRDEGRQTQHSIVSMHFMQITHKSILIILCLFGFLWRFKINSPFLCNDKEWRQIVVLYFKVLCGHLTVGTE